MALVKCGSRVINSVEDVFINEISEGIVNIKVYFNKPAYGNLDFDIPTKLLKINVKGKVYISQVSIMSGKTFIFGGVEAAKCTRHMCIEGNRAIDEIAPLDKISVSKLTKYSEINNNYNRIIKELSKLYKARVLNIDGDLNKLFVNLRSVQSITTIRGKISIMTSESDLLIKGNVKTITGDSITYLQ